MRGRERPSRAAERMRSRSAKMAAPTSFEHHWQRAGQSGGAKRANAEKTVRRTGSGGGPAGFEHKRRRAGQRGEAERQSAGAAQQPPAESSRGPETPRAGGVRSKGPDPRIPIRKRRFDGAEQRGAEQRRGERRGPTQGWRAEGDRCKGAKPRGSDPTMAIREGPSRCDPSRVGRSVGAEQSNKQKTRE